MNTLRLGTRAIMEAHKTVWTVLELRMAFWQSEKWRNGFTLDEIKEGRLPLGEATILPRLDPFGAETVDTTNSFVAPKPATLTRVVEVDDTLVFYVISEVTREPSIFLLNNVGGAGMSMKDILNFMKGSASGDVMPRSEGNLWGLLLGVRLRGWPDEFWPYE